MNELEEKLNSVLNDPAELERITRLAAELMGGGEAPETEKQEDSGITARLRAMLGGGGSDKTELLRALSPYLRPERQIRLRRALHLAKMARLAAAALAEDTGGDYV